MKYLKLFESWLNEAKTNPESFKRFETKLKSKGFSVGEQSGTIWLTTNMQYEQMAPNVTCSLELNFFDSLNPSNKRLMDGITLKPSMNCGSGFADCRWTLDPLEILTANETILQEAKAVKELIKSKFGEYVSKYGWLYVVAGMTYDVCFNGEWGSYWDQGSTGWDVKSLRKTFSKEQIKTMKLNAKSGLRVLEGITKEIESMAKNLFKFELGVSGSLPTAYKLCSSLSKDKTPDRALYAKDLKSFISEVKGGRLDSTPTGAGLNNDLYRAIAYAMGKAIFIEMLYDKKSKLILDVAGIYGNTENKYKPEVLAKWGDISNNMQMALGVNPKELNKYAPDGTYGLAPKKEEEMEDETDYENEEGMEDGMEDENNY